MNFLWWGRSMHLLDRSWPQVLGSDVRDVLKRAFWTLVMWLSGSVSVDLKRTQPLFQEQWSTAVEPGLFVHYQSLLGIHLHGSDPNERRRHSAAIALFYSEHDSSPEGPALKALGHWHQDKDYPVKMTVRRSFGPGAPLWLRLWFWRVQEVTFLEWGARTRLGLLRPSAPADHLNLFGGREVTLCSHSRKYPKRLLYIIYIYIYLFCISFST